MKPQSEVFLEKAQELLGRAETMLRVGLNEDAGRTAYLAGFHAAQGVIFETHSRVFKTHNGVQAEFGRLVADDPSFDLELRAFLSQTYNLKFIADYEIGPGANERGTGSRGNRCRAPLRCRDRGAAARSRRLGSSRDRRYRHCTGGSGHGTASSA